MKKILITGATGFVGSQILKSLSKKDISIRLVVRNHSSEFSKLENIDKIIQTENLFTETEDRLDDICSDIDLIIHSAWYAEPGKYIDSPLNIDCLVGTLNLAKSAVNNGVKKFTGIGTCFEYDLNTSETLSISSPLRPTYPYSAAKAAVFSFLTHYLALYNIDFLWMRLFYLYGENEDSRRLIPFLRDKLSSGQPANLTDGYQVRDFLDVREAGEIIAKESLNSTNGPYNVCSGKGITIKELAENIAEEYNAKHLLNFGEYKSKKIEPPYIVGEKGGFKFKGES